MAAKKWTLLDAENQVWHDEWKSPPSDTANSGKTWASLSTLRAGLSEGVQVLHIDNGRFAFDILPTRGMGIWKAWLGEDPIGWKAPVRGPVHPKFVDLGEPGGLGWLDGFDELLVRCGLENNGAPEFDDKDRLKYPLHGRIANKPAHRVEVSFDADAKQIQVQGIVEEARFHFLKFRMTTTITTQLDSPSFQVRDEIQNVSSTPAEMQILYHINFGPPILDAGARVVAPVKTVVPRSAHAAMGVANWDSYAAETPGFEEQVYFLELLTDASKKTQVLLKNAHGTRGVSLAFPKDQLPWFTVWKDTGGTPDGYVTGLEPGTNFPNPRSYEGSQGRVKKLAAGEKAAFELELTAHGDHQSIEQAETRIRQIQGNVKPKIFDKPQEGWCAP